MLVTLEEDDFHLFLLRLAFQEESRELFAAFLELLAELLVREMMCDNFESGV